MRRSLLFIGALLIHFATHAQPRDYNFYNLASTAGLPTNEIRYIFQDSYGFLWMGSYDGLIRWDGYSFKKYTHNEENKNSITHNIVYCVFEDSQRRLWIGTIEGLNYYDRETDQFIKCTLDHTTEKIPVNAIREDSQHQLWLGTSFGLCRYDYKTGKADWFFQKQPGGKAPSADVVFCMAIDQQDNIWVGTFKGGVHQFNQKTKTFRSFVSEENNPATICSNDISSIYADHQNRIWIGSRHEGITLMDTSGKILHQFTHFSANKTNTATQNIVYSIFQDHHENIWIGVDREPLYTLDPNTLKPVRLSRADFNLKVTDIPHSITSITEDSFGNVWFASTSQGLYYMNPRKNVFRTYLNEPRHTSRSNVVSALYEDEKNNIWIGTEDGGLIQFDPARKSFNLNPAGTALTSEGITDIKGDYRGNLWLATWSGGIIRFNPKTKAIKNYINEPLNSNSLIHNDVKSILPDDTLLWIGTHGNGLAVFDLKNEKFIHFKNNKQFPFAMDAPGWVNHLYKDSRKRLWISSYSGLFLYDGKTLKQFQHSSDTTSISSNSVNMVTEDRSGNIWIISSTGGLDTYNDKTSRFIRYKYKETWPESMKGIAADDHGILWISSNDGIYAFNPEKHTLKNMMLQMGYNAMLFLKNPLPWLHRVSCTSVASMDSVHSIPIA
jgi:ligand-binding sensor domain-containing protein